MIKDYERLFEKVMIEWDMILYLAIWVTLCLVSQKAERGHKTVSVTFKDLKNSQPHPLYTMTAHMYVGVTRGWI